MELPSISTNCCNIYISLTISESVKYLGVEIDNKLRFEDHIDAKVSKARQRLYLVKQFKFLGASDRFLNQIFSAFVESCFFYCLVVIFCNLYERDKKSVRKVYKAAYKAIGIFVVMRVYHCNRGFIDESAACTSNM